ncbi:MAG: hypothetical protein IS632_06370 [Thaumarchaeota archaeon]|nr:hypothetical protein [Nitrososphaerota archaeon]
MGEERKLRQEDCHEDSLGAGILTLTSRRVAFDKTRARIMDFSKHMGETVLDAPLGDITKVWREGLLIKKACIMVDGKAYKFGVLRPGSWVDAIQDAIDEL